MNQGKGLDGGKIHVSWSMESPGLSPRDRVSFDSAESPANAAGTELELGLDWPRGTIAVLDLAFEKRLGRATEWDLSRVSNKAPYVQAARVFRRGVPSTETAQKIITGQYTIDLESHADPLRTLPSEGIRIIDVNVQKLWNIPLRANDRVMALNELTKNLHSVSEILAALRDEDKVVILGGGLLADTAAFAAALLGKPFELVPTTLLAMIDACVGGKTGVNSAKYGKNQIGLFAFPESVKVNPEWLKTLPTREIKAGLAEAYKHAVISRDEHFAKAIASLQPEPDAVKPFLKRLIEVKADVIQKDPNESGLRATLNFGHTLAHALETIAQKHNSSDPLLHGEAIAIGMRFAVHLSFAKGLLPKSVHDSLKNQLRSALFMISTQDFQKHLGAQTNLFPEILRAVGQDKKNTGSGKTSEWVLLKGFGEFAQTGERYSVTVTEEELKNSWEAFASEESLFKY